MEKTFTTYSSFAESDRANRQYYLHLTPQERLDILLDLISCQQDQHETPKGFERVYRIIKLGEH